MQPFEETIKGRSHAEALPVTPESCAALLLDTAPRVMRAVRMAIGALDAPALTVPQFRAMHFVQDHTGASLSATAEFLGLTLPSTSKLIDQLVRRGMLARGDASEDRRRMNLRITEKGNALVQSAQASVRQHLAGMLNRLGAAELAALHATLGLLQESFPSHRGPAAAQNVSGGNNEEPIQRRSRSLNTSARKAAS